MKEVWERRAPRPAAQSPEQLVILASIIEKETGRPEERTRVAAVFVNRLKQKMRLQIGSDHHLRPGRRQGHARPADQQGEIRTADALQHLHDRWPAARADRQSRAAPRSRPPPTRRAPRSSIFVADGTGGHAFAETYDQHQRNVARLRAIEQGGDAADRAAGSRATVDRRRAKRRADGRAAPGPTPTTKQEAIAGPVRQSGARPCDASPNGHAA